MRRKQILLACAALWLIAGIVLTLAGVSRTPAEDSGEKQAAARLMSGWMEAVKGYKAEAGLSLSPEDVHRTGLIGAVYTPITTTHGAIEAKRTSADPNMAALMVQLLDEAGVRPGDTVGAGFSGSFPALNLAVLAACQTLEVRCIYIASVGSSTYGANQPECTFPDMAFRLYRDGLLNWPPALVTPGGVDDCGLDMDAALRDETLARISAYGGEIMEEPDFEKNIQARMELYRREGPIRCFIGVGGNLTTTGLGEQDVGFGVIPGGRIRAADRNSGLIQRYSAQGLPVIHLLNVKRLTADYGLPYDPEVLPAPGKNALYERAAVPRLPGAVCLAGAALTLGLVRVRKKGGAS